MELWICGQLRGEWNPDGRSVWDFQGVFSDEAKADKACRNKSYFIFPTTLDEEQPDEAVLPERGRYPRLVDK